jgi:hypothetical protein
MSINRKANKQITILLHNGILLSSKKQLLKHSTAWMDLKIIILSERSQSKEYTEPVWWYTAIIPISGRWRQEDMSFKASLSYTVRSCLKNSKNYILIVTDQVVFSQNSYVKVLTPTTLTMALFGDKGLLK